MAATNSNFSRFQRRGGRRGFTLVEMLVVIGIILLLIGILLPAINYAYRNSVRTRMASDMQAIVTALQAYQQDHGDIPRTSPEGRAVTGVTASIAGAQILCRAMLGQGDQATDGADGGGFRTIRAIPPDVQGRVYGPYLPADKFKLCTGTTATAISASSTQAQLNTAMLADRSGRPILYYPGLKNADPTIAYVGNQNWGTQAQPFPMFNANDNSSFMDHRALKLLLGDSAAINGKIDAGEVAEFTGPYLLVGAGPDETFGPTGTPPKVPNPLAEPISASNPSDDVVVGPGYSR